MYNLGFVLTEANPATSGTKAKGFMCSTFGVGPNVSTTRDELMVGAVYLGEVIRESTTIDVLRARIGPPVPSRQLKISEEIDSYISVCAAHS